MGRKVIVAGVISLCFVVYLFRYEILKEYVPYSVETVGYLLLGRPEATLSPVFIEQMDLESAENGLEYEFRAEYRGSKAIVLFFNSYNAKERFAGELFSYAKISLKDDQNRLVERIVPVNELGDAHLLKEGRRAVVVYRLNKDMIRTKKPMWFALQLVGDVREINARHGKCYVAVVNLSDY